MFLKVLEGSQRFLKVLKGTWRTLKDIECSGS